MESIWSVDLGDGSTRAVGESWHRLDSAQWLPDVSALVVNATLEEGRPSQIWLVDYPGGKRTPVGGQPGNYDNAVIMPDGKRILARHTVRRSEVVVSREGEPGTFQRTLTGTEVTYSLCWTVNREIVVSSNEGGTYDLYALDPENGSRRQLTFDSTGDERNPAASPDGRYVVFNGHSGSNWSVFRIGLDGGGLLRLTPPTPEGRWMPPQISPDGKWVLFQDWDGGPQLSMVSIDGGTPRVIKGSPVAEPSSRTPREYAFGGAWSPNESEIAFFYFTRTETWSPTDIAISTPEGLIRKKLPLGGQGLRDQQHLEWSRDGRYLYYVHYFRDGNLWKQPVMGGPATRVTSEELVDDFDWSFDGKSLALSRVTRLSDVVLISNFR